MRDIVRRAQYFKVQVPNKPGEAVRLLDTLEDATIHLLAFLAFPRNRRSQLDFVPSDPAAFQAAAKQAKWKIQGPKICFVVEGEDRVGAVASHAHRLAKAKVNIRALAAAGGGAGRYGFILWVKPKDAKRGCEGTWITVTEQLNIPWNGREQRASSGA